MPETESSAHQLRNLAQAISGYLELIASKTVDETYLHYVANAQTAATEMAELARRIATTLEDHSQDT